MKSKLKIAQDKAFAFKQHLVKYEQEAMVIADQINSLVIDFNSVTDMLNLYKDGHKEACREVLKLQGKRKTK